jgi:hypothetical protein
MLQHNVTAARARRAHAAHAAVVGGHLFCCGIPLAVVLLSAGTGVSAGVSAVAQWFGVAHAWLHAHEAWLLGASAFLVLLGGALEARVHGGRRFSALFVLSLLCFTLNVGLIWSHRSAPPSAQASAALTQPDAGSLTRRGW